MGFLNSSFSSFMVNCYNPTLHFNVADVQYIPFGKCKNSEQVESLASEAVEISKLDWDMFETSIDFTRSPLINNKNSILDSYLLYRNIAEQDVKRLKELEKDINL